MVLATSQRAQVVRHIAELPDHLGIAEIAGGRITGATERDSTDVLGIAARLGKNITMIGKLMYDSSYDESHGDGQRYPDAAGKNLLLQRSAICVEVGCRCLQPVGPPTLGQGQRCRLRTGNSSNENLERLQVILD